MKPTFSAARSRAALLTANAPWASVRSPVIRAISSLLIAPFGLQGLGTLVISVQARQPSFALDHVALGTSQFGVVRAPVNFEQQISLIDVGPLSEVNFLEIAGDSSP